MTTLTPPPPGTSAAAPVTNDDPPAWGWPGVDLAQPGPAETDPGPGRPADDRPWVRPAVVALLAATGLLYLWDLGASGWANAYYSAAVQAGAQSWEAFFFGSFDSANSITVDKTPASLWIMDLSVRIFGLNSWSLLVPQALMGVATVWLLYAAVRRASTPAAGLVAGAVLATTPVAALMFRFNNPDALLVLLLVGSAYATLRALERASTRWLVLAATLVGFGFLSKMLQALIVVPILAAVYLVAAPTGLGHRFKQLVLAGAALVVSAGWWVAIVELMPASARPYIGGSQTNSVLELMLGYNGLGRLTGAEDGSVGGGSGWGQAGWLRLLGADIGGQVAWLLPAALVLMVAGLALRGRRPRTDLLRAALMLWGGWLLLTGAVFSLMQGIFHPYYTVALAPAIGALVGMGAVALWTARDQIVARIALAVIIGGSGAWTYLLLSRSPEWLPWLRSAILLAALIAATLVLLGSLLPRGVGAAIVSLALAAGLAAPAAASVSTAATPHTGSIPSAGPQVTASVGPGGGRQGGPGGHGLGPGGGTGPGGGFAPGGPPGGATGNGPPATGAGPGPGAFPRGGAGQAPPGRGGGFGGGFGGGGLLDASTPSDVMVELLTADADSYTWVAATVGANNAAGYQLAAQKPVMAIGGFNGSDPSPTLAQFQAWVSEGKIHYFLGGSGFMSNGGSDFGAQIASWVAANFTAQDVDGVTVYDLTTGSFDGIWDER